MKFTHKMELALIVITALLCIILLFNLLFKLRYFITWRVNCWFCNNNNWVKFIDRNRWTCPKCEQYNGFTKDGDYNKQITSSDTSFMTPKSYTRSPPQNGLCKMCNINQQLKVAQLANFVPINEKRFDQEVESYRLQLEKAYKLCSQCRKVLQMKLHKEKETLLGSKLLETRTPDKKNQRNNKRNDLLKKIVNQTSNVIACILLVLVAIEFYRNVKNNKKLYSVMINLREIFINILERFVLIIEMKTSIKFPNLEDYKIDLNFDKISNYLDYYHNIIYSNEMIQKALSGVACVLQIIGHFCKVNNIRHSAIIDLLWTLVVTTSIVKYLTTLNPLVLSALKMFFLTLVILIYKYIKKTAISLSPRLNSSSKRLKTFSNRSFNSKLSDEETLMDTDDDVSLSKFGLNNLSESSADSSSPINKSSISSRSFTSRNNDSVWKKPKFNSNFCVNTLLSKTASPISDPAFIKPSFNKYQDVTKDDSDSDLDESISSLYIGSPKKSKKCNSLFTLRKFTATPNFVAPSPMARRPLISPSKLGHGTSWVAGGYWGNEGERHIFSVNGSRSSSQSSGFESQASSVNQRNGFSHPPSREDSICGEPERSTNLFDRFSSCNLNSVGFYNPQSFSRVSSPVFPQMQFNNHVHLPQPRMSQASSISNQSVFSQPYVQMNTFKAPRHSGLIKLPSVNSFTSQN